MGADRRHGGRIHRRDRRTRARDRARRRPTVGLGGITLGGGIGFLVRRNGLTIDDVLAAEVVTADGEIVESTGRTTPASSGPSAAAAATSVSRPDSGCGWTRLTTSSAGCCSCPGDADVITG